MRRPSSIPRQVLSPGTYLRKRREAMGLGIRQAAANLAASPWALKRPTAEDERDLFTVDHARLLRNVVSLDIEVYAQLLAVHADPDNPDLPRPQVCRGCACSWMDACLTDRGPCAWAEPDLCTGCLRKMDLTAELGRASRVYALHDQPTPQVPA